MPLVKAVCTSCGAPLEVDNCLDAAICPYCNTPYVVEKAINIYENKFSISGSIVNIYNQESSGSQKTTKLLEQAKLQMKFKDYDKAFEIYKQIVAQCPEDYRGWVALLDYIHDDMRRHDYDSIRAVVWENGNAVTPPEILERIRITAPVDEIYDEAKNNYDVFWHTVYLKVIRGESNCLWEGYSKELTDFYLRGKQRAQQLIDAGVYYGSCIHLGGLHNQNNVVSWWPTLNVKHIPEFFVADNFVLYPVQTYDDRQRQTAPIRISPILENTFITSVQKIAKKNIRNLRCCPFCGYKKINHSLLNDKCTCKQCNRDF